MQAVRNKNFDTVLKFELLYNLLLSLVVLPLIKLVVSLITQTSGLFYLIPADLFSYMKVPISIAGFLLILLLVICSTVWEITALHLVYVASQKGHRLSLSNLFLLTFQQSRPIFHNFNPLFFVYTGLLLSLSGIIYENPLLQNATVPVVIVYGVAQNPTMVIGVISLLAVAIVFFYTNLYTFQVMLTKPCPYGCAWKKSRQTISRTRQKTVRWVFKCIGLGVVVLLGTVGFSAFAVWVLKTIQNPVVHTPIATVLFLCNLFLSLVGTCFLKVLYVCESNAVYFEAYPLPDICTSNRQTNVPVVVQITASLLAILMIGSSIAVLWVFGEAGRVAVMAHRGSSVEALENTQAAFELAMDEGAEYLELDVVETKDHALVILHDLDLVRLAGVDKRVSNLTLSELQRLPIHSLDGKNSAQIMALSDLLPLIRPNVILNIEVKPEGNNDTRMAHEVERILSDFPRHIVSSFSPNVIKEIKERNPNRKTGLIINQTDEIQNVRFVDFYSIEHSLLTAELVRTIHQTGKDVFVWTVNDTALMPAYVSYGVDGIITDVPNEMKKAILSASLNFNSHALERLFLS